jgi:formylglycine-generating enzyme
MNICAKTAVILVLSVAIFFSVTACQIEDPAPDYSELVSVPGSTFVQCSDLNYDGDVIDPNEAFSLTISGFRIAKYETVYDLWYSVYQWALTNGYSFGTAGQEGSDGVTGAAPTSARYEPVCSVNWTSVIVWCNAYSQLKGLVPVYCSDSSLTTPIKDTTALNINDPYVNWAANGFRLPTECEWQCAASWKGTDSSNNAFEWPATSGKYWTPFKFASGATADYSNATATGLVGWYDTNSGMESHDAGCKTPNALGIYDMSGNMREWCWDWKGPSSGYSGVWDEYRGPLTGSERIMRGGAYNFGAVYLQVGDRLSMVPGAALSAVGFRVARTQ